MAYKQNWGLSRRHYQGNTSPMNRMPHMDRLEKQSQTKFAGIDEEILPPSPLGNCGCPSPLNQEEEAYNMTPDATEEESKAVRDKFDETYMKGGSGYDFDSDGNMIPPTPGGSEGPPHPIHDLPDNKLKEAFKSVAENVAMTPFITPISGVVTGLKTAYDIYKKNKK